MVKPNSCNKCCFYGNCNSAITLSSCAFYEKKKNLLSFLSLFKKRNKTKLQPITQKERESFWGNA